MRSVWALPSNPPRLGPQLVERHLAVVAEGRVTQVVGQRRGLGQVGVAAQRVGEVAGDLGDLEGVGEPVADEVVGAGTQHLGLGGQPSQRRRVHHAGPVALERGALGGAHPLGRLVHPTLPGVRVVELLPGGHAATLPAPTDGRP